MQQKALGAHEVKNTEVAMRQSGQHSGKQANMDCFSTHRFGKHIQALVAPWYSRPWLSVWSSSWWPLWPWSNGKNNKNI